MTETFQDGDGGGSESVLVGVEGGKHNTSSGFNYSLKYQKMAPFFVIVLSCFQFGLSATYSHTRTHVYAI